MSWCITHFLLLQKTPKKQNFRWHCKGERILLPSVESCQKKWYPHTTQSKWLPPHRMGAVEERQTSSREERRGSTHSGQETRGNPRRHNRAGPCRGSLPDQDGGVHLDTDRKTGASVSEKRELRGHVFKTWHAVSICKTPRYQGGKQGTQGSATSQRPGIQTSALPSSL